ncbi:DUF2335 domain-containing protein [bacterium]|nr:DUF2335 domain-containing protein [bacterium]MBU1652593.1 DUF2335 domain-containing protein [bacterium]MBU1880519.1 DUF2335 domain-containing protein [bacterium]
MPDSEDPQGEDFPTEPEDIGDVEEIPRETKGLVTIQQELYRRGPLPMASEFEVYERTLTGAGDRIIKIAENEQQHRFRMDIKEFEFEEKKLSAAIEGVKDQRVLERRGQTLGSLLAAFIIVCGVILAMYDHEWVATTLIVSTLTIVFGGFLFTRQRTPVKTTKDLPTGEDPPTE